MEIEKTERTITSTQVIIVCDNIDELKEAVGNIYSDSSVRISVLTIEHAMSKWIIEYGTEAK